MSWSKNWHEHASRAVASINRARIHTYRPQKKSRMRSWDDLAHLFSIRCSRLSLWWLQRLQAEESMSWSRLMMQASSSWHFLRCRTIEYKQARGTLLTTLVFRRNRNIRALRKRTILLSRIKDLTITGHHLRPTISLRTIQFHWILTRCKKANVWEICPLPQFLTSFSKLRSSTRRVVLAISIKIKSEMFKSLHCIKMQVKRLYSRSELKVLALVKWTLASINNQ